MELPSAKHDRHKVEEVETGFCAECFEETGFKIRILDQSECDFCLGEDKDMSCGPFCPVCNYCCGC